MKKFCLFLLLIPVVWLLMGAASSSWAPNDFWVTVMETEDADAAKAALEITASLALTETNAFADGITNKAQANAAATFAPLANPTFTGALSAPLVTADNLVPLLFTPTFSPQALRWENEALTFSGWSQFCGDVGDFQAVHYCVRQWSSSYPITTVRTVIRDGDYTGAILADKTVTVPSRVVGDQIDVYVDFGIRVPGTNVWVEYLTDGKTGFLIASQFAATLKTNRYNTASTPANPTNGWSSGSSMSQWFIEFGHCTNSYVDTLELQPAKNTHFQLAATNYAVEGREFNLYWDNILTATSARFDFGVTGPKVTNYLNRLTFIPAAADAGTHSIYPAAFLNGELVSAFKTRVLIKAATNGTGVTRKLLVIGDSTTANGIWLAELANLFSGDVMTVVQTGTKTGSTTDADGEAQTYTHESITGYKASLFIDSTNSPFVFSGTFEFSTYLTTNSISMSTNDWVLINLGLNDMFAYESDLTATEAAADVIADYTTMIASIKAAIPGIRIGVCVPIPPSSSQDAFGKNYANGQERWRYLRNRSILVDKILNQAWGSNVVVLPIHAGIDTVNNFPTETVQVNARNTNTVALLNNALHPSNAGYWQIADQVFAFLKCNE